MTIVKIEVDRNLSSGSKTYAPGQIVKGNVYLKEDYGKRRGIQNCTITFTGQAAIETTSPGRRSAFTSSDFKDVVVPFFSTRRVLQLPSIESQLQSEEAMIVPFEFRFPASRGFMGGVEEESLPSDITVYFDGTFGVHADFTASISYTLEVRADLGGGMFRDLPPSVKKLKLRPVFEGRFPDAPMQQIMFPLTGWTSESLRESQISTKQKMRGLFSKKLEHKTPSIVFQAFLAGPTTLFVGQETILSFGLQHIPQSPNDPPSPTLILRSVALKLQRSITGPGGSQSTGDVSSILWKFNLELPLNNASVPVSADFGLNKFVRRDDFVPDFELGTPQILCSNRLKVDLAVEHRESGHVFETTCFYPVKILPRPKAWVLPENVGELPTSAVHEMAGPTEELSEASRYEMPVLPGELAGDGTAVELPAHS